MDPKIFASRLTLALPKQEKLKTPILDYIQARGFSLEEDGETGILFDTKGNIPNIRIEFVRAADALLLMERGVADIAIIGSDIAEERTYGENPDFQKPNRKMDLGVAKCTFELAVPDKRLKEFKTTSDLNGMRIATSYPNLLSEWLKQNNVTPKEILVREGGVESSIRMGLVDVVADLVDTGGTLRRNQLTKAFLIADTSAVGYSRKNAETIKELLANEFFRTLATRVPTSKQEIAAEPAIA